MIRFLTWIVVGLVLFLTGCAGGGGGWMGGSSTTNTHEYKVVFDNEIKDARVADPAGDRTPVTVYNSVTLNLSDLAVDKDQRIEQGSGLEGNLGLNQGQAAGGGGVVRDISNLLRQEANQTDNSVDNKAAPSAKPEESSSTKDTASPVDPDAGPVAMARYHHYNPDASEMGSAAVSFVLCPGQSFDECELDKTPFVKHGQLDDGRETWVLYGQTNIGGTVTCINDTEILSESFAASGMQFGSCD